MSEIIPNEGLDLLVSLALKQAAVPSTWLGLFIGGSATTVPAATATLAAMGGTFAEAAYTSYARVPITSANWGALTTLLGGRGCTGAEQSFAAAGAAYGTPINGYFISTVANGTAGIVLGYANFDEGTIASLALGAITKVTPRWALLG